MQPQIRNFRDLTSPQIQHLAETAEFLSISEVEIFKLAYRYWYERSLSDRLLDDLLGEYLNEQRLPGWVRAYCTRVLQAAATGRFDPRKFGVERPDSYRSLDQQFLSYLTFFGFLVCWLFLA
jgi:hypothetical protein